MKLSLFITEQAVTIINMCWRMLLSKPMKIQFKKQAFQTAAVEAVTDCFAGQPMDGGLHYRIDPSRREASPQQMFITTWLTVTSD